MPVPPHRRRAASVAIAVLVTAAVVLSTGAFVLANASDGAADPETAARTFVEAAAARDGRGLLAASLPSERDAILAHLPGILEQAQRLGLVGPIDLGAAASADVSARDLRTESQRVDVDTFRVTVNGGHLQGTWSEEGLPISPELRRFVVDDLGLDPPVPGESFDVDLAQHPLVLMSVRELGGWHVSLYETVAEHWRVAAAAPETSFGRGPVATGADTPEAVVSDLFEAGANLDAGRAVALAYPPEMRALYDYAPLFLPASRRDARKAAEDDGFSLTIHDLGLEATGEGRERTVRVTRASATWGAGDQWVRMRYADGCATYEYAPTATADATRTERRCDGDVSAPSAETAAAPFRQVSAFSELGRIFPTFVVLERSGRWFLSPTRTLLGTLEEILTGLHPDQAGDLLDRLGEVWQVYRPEADEAGSTSPLAALGATPR
ncbi:MAG: hypothetical protein U0Q07_05190 [Acidimicrobiales bacterium]